MNHASDINAVINAMTYDGLDKKGVLITNKTVINGTESYHPFLLKHYRDYLERYIALEPGRKVAINEVEVQALTANHSEPNTIGFKFFTPQFVLTYSSDTKYSQELIEEYKNSNILILNVLSPKKQDSNLCTEDAIKIIKAVKPKLAIIQHFGIDMIKSDPLYETREIQKATKVQTLAAKDGMVLDPVSYAVHQGQRTLHAFNKNISAEAPTVEVKEIKSDIQEEDRKLGDIFLKEAR
jgi:ribonuclease BN (tRNA processing enzyme)